MLSSTVQRAFLYCRRRPLRRESNMIADTPGMLHNAAAQQAFRNVFFVCSGPVALLARGRHISSTRGRPFWRALIPQACRKSTERSGTGIGITATDGISRNAEDETWSNKTRRKVRQRGEYGRSDITFRDFPDMNVVARIYAARASDVFQIKLNTEKIV